MKIYTKNGDKGNTTLVGGNKISKDSIIVEAYGSIDELISYIGFAYGLGIDKYHKNLLSEIQNKLMLCASHIADIRKNNNILNIDEKDVKYVEEQIDKMDKDLKPLKNFVLFQGSVTSSINILRTLTRKSERKVIKLNNTKITKNILFKDKLTKNENIPIIIKYLNRLSDLFFIMTRHIGRKYNSEVLWKI